MQLSGSGAAMRRAVAKFNGLLRGGRNRKRLQITHRLRLLGKPFILEGLILEGLGDHQTLPEELS
jgi:hypothetical protein